MKGSLIYEKISYCSWKGCRICQCIERGSHCEKRQIQLLTLQLWIPGKDVSDTCMNICNTMWVCLVLKINMLACKWIETAIGLAVWVYLCCARFGDKGCTRNAVHRASLLRVQQLLWNDKLLELIKRRWNSSWADAAVGDMTRICVRVGELATGKMKKKEFKKGKYLIK